MSPATIYMSLSMLFFQTNWATMYALNFDTSLRLRQNMPSTLKHPSVFCNLEYTCHVTLHFSWASSFPAFIIYIAFKKTSTCSLQYIYNWILINLYVVSKSWQTSTSMIWLAWCNLYLLSDFAISKTQWYNIMMS